MNDRIPILVLGLGNVLCSDDGVGVAAVHALRRAYALPDEVVAIDGGTLGLGLLPLIADADRVLLVDAVRTDAPPGTLVRLEGAQVPAAVYERLSPHQIGVADLLAGAALIDRYPDRVLLLGVVPSTTDLGLTRSRAVDEALPALVAAIVDELADLGHPLSRPPAGESPEHRSDHGARALGL